MLVFFVISVFNRIRVDDGKERDNCETEAVLNCVYNSVYLLILKQRFEVRKQRTDALKSN